jgi:prevent-host-death family protein
MLVVGVREAKDRMAELINRALAGEEVTIARRGIEVARLEALSEVERARLRSDLTRPKKACADPAH